MSVKDESLKQVRQRNCIVEIGNSFEEDITSYVMNINVNHTLNGDTYLINEINPSTSGLMIKNYNNYFKDKQLSKLPIIIKSGYNGINEEVFRGYLKRDSYRVGSKELSLSSESYLQVFKKPIINKEMLENYFVEDIVKRAIQECVTDGTPYELQRTGIRIPVCSLNEFENWSSLLALLMSATQYILIYEDNKFRFRKFWDSLLPSVFNFTVDNIKEIVQTKTSDEIKNSIMITSNYKSVAPKDKLSENLTNQTQIDNEVYYIQEGFNNRIQVKNYPLFKDQELVDGEFKYKTDTTVFIIDPNSSRFGEKVLINDLDVNNGYIHIAENLPTSTKVSVSYKYLQLQLNPYQERTYVVELSEEGKNVQLRCAAWKNTSQTDTGERVPYSTIEALDTIHLTNTIEQKDNKIRFTLKNNTNSNITISTLQAYGNPIKAFSPIKAKYKNPVSVTKYGEKVLEINNDFIVSTEQAGNLGVFLYSNCSDLVDKIEVQLPQHLPFLKIGDRVTITENSTSINYDFMVTSISHSYNENEWSTSFNAIKYPKLLSDIIPDYLSKDNQGDYISNNLFNDTPLSTPLNFAVQYNNNTDGSKNIALSWSDADKIESPRDGYEIFIQVKTATGVYTVDLQNDMHFSVSPEARGVILKNLPHMDGDLTNYYGFAIRPFRNVHIELTSDKSGILRGEIQYFNTNLTALDGFTVYSGTSIEDAISGNKESSSVDLANKILHSVDKGVDYAYSLGINDFKGLTVKANTGNGVIDRVVVGQFAPHKFGQQIRNGDGNVVLQADEQGLKLINSDFIVTTSTNTTRTIINPTDGIKIQKNENGVWNNKFYADTNGDLILDGNLTRGTGNNVFKATFNGIQLGHDTFSSSPFRVDMTGALTATKGNIGGWTIANNSLSTVVGTGTNKIYIGAGTYNTSTTPFYVDDKGQFSLGSKLRFDGTNLVLASGTITWDNLDFNTQSTINSSSAPQWVYDWNGGNTVVSSGYILSPKMYAGTGGLKSNGVLIDEYGITSHKDGMWHGFRLQNNGHIQLNRYNGVGVDEIADFFYSTDSYVPSGNNTNRVYIQTKNGFALKLEALGNGDISIESRNSTNTTQGTGKVFIHNPHFTGTVTGSVSIAKFG